MIYVLMPGIAWVVSGTLKFLINYLRFGGDAFKRVGYGGFPSTHTSIVSAMAFLIGFDQGFETAFFGLALTLLTVTVIDATALRRTIGRHATILNLHLHLPQPLRELQGHHWYEVAGVLAVGAVLGYAGALLI